MASNTTEMMDLPTQVPPTVAENESPEELERKLHETQAIMASKIGLVEDRTLGSVRDTLGSVNDTANTVQGFINDPMAAVQSIIGVPFKQIQDDLKDSLVKFKDDLDPGPMVRKHPLASLGVAALSGFITGWVFLRSPSNTATHIQGIAGTPANSQEPGLFDDLIQQLGSEVKKVSKELIQSTSQTLIDQVRSALGQKTTGKPQ